MSGSRLTRTSWPHSRILAAGTPMRKLPLFEGLALLLTASVLLAARAQLPERPENAPAPGAEHYRDLDLLRADNFRDAQTATAVLRITDKSGNPPADLQARDLLFFVNGTPRAGRLHPPEEAATPVVPLVLLVFPPNQPLVHSIGVRQATKYFARQAETLPWKVGIFDSNAKLTAFTTSRAELLANLQTIDHTLEPFQFTTGTGLPGRFQWGAGWHIKAVDVIAAMGRSSEPKIILAINPWSIPMYGENEDMLAQDGPASLVNIAQQSGAHIYVANVGGPEVLVPGGDASSSGRGFNLTSALNHLAFSTSLVMQTAQDTFGGFSNSLSELAGKIDHDLQGNYRIDFDLIAEDTDRGAPAVAVHLLRRDLRAAVLEVVPYLAPEQPSLPKQVLAAIRATEKHPGAPGEFRIAQRVDYFPLRDGLAPILPMTAAVAWTGPGAPPPEVRVAEFVDDVDVGMPVLSRELDAPWDGRSLSWERDGRLRPGNYMWRVAVHDSQGRVLASSQEKVAVGLPRSRAVALSSLLVGTGCRAPVSGLRRRNDSADTQDTRLLIDPMHAGTCRLEPSATGSLDRGEALRAFVRVYPGSKWDKKPPGSWTATFRLQAASGAVIEEKETAFTIDSGSGYLASVELPLPSSAIPAGAATLSVAVTGPGIKGALDASRALSITR